MSWSSSNLTGKIKDPRAAQTAEGVTTPKSSRSSKMNHTQVRPSLLASGYFIQLHTEMVKKLGSATQAMCLQQLSYWLERSDNEHNDQIWVYNTYESWSENLGLSVKQIRSAMQALEDLGVVISCQPKAYDRTKWYTIDYDHEFWGESISPEGQTQAPTRADGSALEGSSTSYTKNTQREPKEALEVEPIVDDLCNYLADAIEVRGLKKRPSAQTVLTHRWQHEMKLLLSGRIGEGDTLENVGDLEPEQIKTAIDWAMNSAFWCKNILSPNSLRLKYPRMRMEAQSEKIKKQSKSERFLEEFRKEQEMERKAIG
jgi:hypothetical protein